MFYISRERYILAVETNRPVEPHAAVVARVNYDKTGAPTGAATLLVFDPELGAYPKRDVRFSTTVAPECFMARPKTAGAVPVELLRQLIDVAVEEAIDKALAADGPEPAADPGEKVDDPL